jgi:RNA polymerase sigma-70 factor (sigma-E family)
VGHDLGTADEEFAAFVIATQHRLRRVAFLVCGDWHRAEDIVQTALTQVYARWERIRPAEGPVGYARRAVVNAAIDERRRPWRREHTVDRLPDVAAAPAREAYGGSAIDQAIAALPPRQRAVIVLRYIEDLDVESTAALLGISPGTVRSQATRGLASMREHMGIGADQGAGR